MSGSNFLKGALVAALTMMGAGASAQTIGVTPTSIKIGFVGSLTGPAAIWGSGNLAGATLAFEEANAKGGIFGRKIEVVPLDDESSAPKGSAAFNKLVQAEKVFMVFGPSASAVGVPMKKVMADSGVPIVIPSFSSPDMTDPLIKNIFRTGTLNDRVQGHAIADYLVKTMKVDKIAILRQSDQYGATGAAAIIERLKELEKAPAAVEIFNASDTDMTSQVLRLRGADPQAIVIYGYPSPSAIATRQIRELGMTAEIFGSNAASNQNYPELVGKIGVGTKFAANSSFLTEGTAEPMASFRDAFQKRFPDLARQGRPTTSDVNGYGGALNVLEGLRRAGKDLTRENFMAALETFNGFETGIVAPTYFSPTRHEGNTKMWIMRITPELTREVLPDEIDAQ
jgi:branched-chain amino acid transport system substrate-binding protein